MKKLILIFSIVCLGVTFANAQGSLTALEYSIGFGSGDMGTNIASPSFRGFTFQWQKLITDQTGVGLELGWNVFYEAKANDTYTSGNTSISGKQYRYQNELPILVTYNYYLKPGEKLNPFFGIGAGTMYSKRNTNMSTYTLESTAWQFAFRPEVGFLYEFSSETSAYVSVKYYNGLTAGDFNAAQSYFSLNLGFAFRGH